MFKEIFLSLLQTTINPLTLLLLLLKLGKLGQLALCLSARGVIIHERKRKQSWIINVLISFNWQRGLVCFLVQLRRFNFVRWITINSKYILIMFIMFIMFSGNEKQFCLTALVRAIVFIMFKMFGVMNSNFI